VLRDYIRHFFFPVAPPPYLTSRRVKTPTMAPGAASCDWTSDPGDKIALVAFFASIKDQIGQGGSWDPTALEAWRRKMQLVASP